MCRHMENAVTLTCSLRTFFLWKKGRMKCEGGEKREVVEEGKEARHKFSEAKPKVLRSRKRNF